MKFFGANRWMGMSILAVVGILGLTGMSHGQFGGADLFLTVKAPSEVQAGQPFTVRVVPLYNWTNGTAYRWYWTCLTTNGMGPVTLSVEGVSGSTRTVPMVTSALAGSQTIYWGETQVALSTPGWYRLVVNCPGSAAYSAAPTVYFPVKVVQNLPSERLYWGEIHTHSVTDDTFEDASNMQFAYQYGKNVASLDFATCIIHHWKSHIATAWPDLVSIGNSFNDPGHFVTLLGYETGTGDRVGNRYYHNNVYFAGDTGTVTPNPYFTVTELWTWLDANVPAGTLAIPHHPANSTIRTDWADPNAYNPKYQKVVEIFSHHGNSEYSGAPHEGNCTYGPGKVQEALARGYKLGFIAGSDRHDGQTGLPQGERDGGMIGVAAVRASALNRQGIINAITNRNCYAATNAQRIIVEFTLNGYRMGEEAKIGNVARNMNIEVGGTADIATIELIKNNNVIHTWTGTGWHMAVNYTDPTQQNPTDYYYVRVTQADTFGNLAWSSPIWVEPAAPNANAGPDATDYETELCQLDGSQSTNTTTYQWTQIAGKSVGLFNANTDHPSFTVPAVATKTEAQMTFRLTATNSEGSDTDEVNIRVRILGDANGDDKVDSADRRIWLLHYDPLGSNPANSFDTGDFNGDGRIDSADRRVWLLHYNPLGLPN